MIVTKNVRGHTALTCVTNSAVLDNVVIVSEAMGKFLSVHQARCCTRRCARIR